MRGVPNPQTFSVSELQVDVVTFNLAVYILERSYVLDLRRRAKVWAVKDAGETERESVLMARQAEIVV